MNYIRHLNQLLECFARDKRILPRHISMYMALFQLWNRVKFAESIYFSRNELMPLAKIGSGKFYYLTLKELDGWGYIRYYPSKSIYEGSCVRMVACSNSATSGETSSGSSTETSTGTSGDTTTETSSAPSSETTSGRTGSTININTNKTLLNQTNSNETVIYEREHASDAHPTDTTKKDAVSPNQESPLKRFQKPSMAEIESYFEERQAPKEEAQRFFNYFESVGWKVGGKSPMKDWKAAIRNWLLNMSRYKANKADTEQAKYLSTTNEKDYGEPL